MKFNDGFWKLRDGVSAVYAMEAFDVRTTAKTVSVAALARRVEHRGSHLNTPTVTVELASPAPDTVSVSLSRRVPTAAPSVAFEVAELPNEVIVTQDDKRVSLTSGRLSASISVDGPFDLTFANESARSLTSAGFRATASMSVARETGGDENYMMQRLQLPVGANVYGLGERFTAFVKNGQVVDTWNEDGGTTSEQAYKAIPFLITDAGFGVFVDSPGRVSFEVGSEVVSSVQFAVPGDAMTYHVIHGTPKQILETYTAMTGRPALPPLWSFGLWLSTSFTADYDEQSVMSFVDGMAEREIPLSVFHFDCYWMKPLNWCDFVWDPDTFPDPEGLLSRLTKRGLHPSVWINSYLGQRSRLFDEAAREGYLVRRADGSVWQWDMWVAGMAMIDFTNPAARDWFREKVRGLLRQGVHAIKADFGERVPLDVVWHDGSDPALMHNYYSLLYNRTVFEAVEQERGVGEAVLFSRSATVGGQKFPVHWGGDCESTYVSMAESLRGGLSLGLSGFGFWSHDIGGFEGPPSPAMFKRWLLFGLFSSHARLHGSESYRVPWAFDQESVDIARRFTRFRNELAPYLWASAIEAHRHGIPMMRPMVLEFPDDPTCAPLDRQYMLGNDLLVAPVFEDEGDVRLYVPEGIWIGLLDGVARTGAGWHRETHAFDSIPVLVRPGTVLPLSSDDERPDADHLASPVFEVFALGDGAVGTATLHNLQGAPTATIEVSRSGNTLTAELTEGAAQITGSWTLRWVTGPLGEERGPQVMAAAGDAKASLAIA